MSTSEEQTELLGPSDIFGAIINAGDTIVYATRRGSTTKLNKLEVTLALPGTIKGFEPDDPIRRVRILTNFNTIAKVH